LPYPMRDTRAVTLVELLVAVAVFAVLTTVFWTFFVSATRVQTQQSDYMAAMAEVLRVWRYLEDDLRTVSLDSISQPAQLHATTLAAIGIPCTAYHFPLVPRYVDFIAMTGG